jgi:hypothetical protein
VKAYLHSEYSVEPGICRIVAVCSVRVEVTVAIVMGKVGVEGGGDVGSSETMARGWGVWYYTVL